MNKVKRQLQFEESQANRASEMLGTLTGRTEKDSMTPEERLLADSLAALAAAIRKFSEQPLANGKAAMTHHVAYLKKLGYERAVFVTMQEVLDALFDKEPKVVNFAFGLSSP
jgi:hypothetical protein